MQDDIEFFTGENLELQAKVKEVCMHNAQLKLQISKMLGWLEAEQKVIIRDSLSGEREEHQLEDVLTARNDLENEEEGLENAMFEVAKNSHEDIEQDDLGNDLAEEPHLQEQHDDDFVSEGSFRDVV